MPKPQAAAFRPRDGTVMTKLITARLMLDALPKAKTLIADRGYDSNWFRATLKKRGTEPCIPPTRSRKIPLAYDKALYRTRPCCTEASKGTRAPSWNHLRDA
jgi:hypothetical protein